MARIRVRLKDGREGTIDSTEFDPQSMTNLDSQSVKTVATKALGGLTDFLIPETKKEATNLFQGKPVDLGDAARVALELGSFAIPFGKGAGLLSKAILPGAGVGLARGLSQEQKTPESVLASTAVGGATAGIVNPLLDKVLGIGKGASTLGSKMAAPKVKLPYSVFAPEEEQLISQTLLNTGKMKGSSANQYAQMPKIFSDVTKQVDEKLAQSTASITEKEFKKGLSEKLKLAPYDIDPEYSATLLARLQKTDKGYRAQSFNDFKKTLNKVAGLKNIFRKANNELGGALTPKEQTALAMWEFSDDMVRQLAPEAKELTLTQSYLMRAAPSLGKEASKNLALSPLGIPTGINLNRPISATTNAVGRGVGAVGSGLDRVLNPVRQGLRTPAGQLGLTETAVGIGNQPEQPQALEAQAPQINPELQQLLGLKQQLETLKTQQAGGLGQTPSKEQFQQLVLQDLAQTGGKNISKIAAASKFFEGDEANLSAEDKKKVGQLDRAETIIDNFAQQLEGIGSPESAPLARLRGVGVSLGGPLGLAPADLRAFRQTRSGLKVQLARSFGEVGNLSATEQQAALELIPDIGDSAEEVAIKVASLKGLLGQLRSTYTNKAQTQAPTSEESLYQLLGL